MRFFAMFAFVAMLGLVATGCGGDKTKPAGEVTAAQDKSGADHKDSHDHAHDHDHDHDHAGHSHATTFPGAVEELVALKNKVAEAEAAGDISKADHEIHEVGHVLTNISELADKTKLSAEDKAEINKSIGTLLDLFAGVDAKVHGGEGPNYSDVATEVDAAIAVFQAKAALPEAK